jgi:asparagine synthase (glutamine-hydrolysing)
MMPYLTAGIERYARLAAYAGVEQRQPLLDKRLIEFCVSLPWDQKCRDGWSKFAMRKLAERVLPASVAWRPGWEQISGKFSEARSKLNREEEIETALAAAQELRGVVCEQKVRDRIRKLQNGDSDFDQQLVDFVNLARWLKRVT